MLTERGSKIIFDDDFKSTGKLTALCKKEHYNNLLMSKLSTA